jgi:membrane fusion protein, multidrug efflux system
VRIALDPQDLVTHPLRIGLSMDVTVDTLDQSGKAVADAPRASAGASTTVFDGLSTEADAAVQRIILTGLGRPLAGAAPRTVAP